MFLCTRRLLFFRTFWKSFTNIRKTYAHRLKIIIDVSFCKKTKGNLSKLLFELVVIGFRFRQPCRNNFRSWRPKLFCSSISKNVFKSLTFVKKTVSPKFTSRQTKKSSANTAENVSHQWKSFAQIPIFRSNSGKDKEVTFRSVFFKMGMTRTILFLQFGIFFSQNSMFFKIDLQKWNIVKFLKQKFSHPNVNLDS